MKKVSAKTAAALTVKVAAMTYQQRVAALEAFPTGKHTPEQALEYIKLAIGSNADFTEE
jgi:hypothetical protein